ncbi:MAG: SEL1-like repeat protein [Elusimicrobia bacterium]|nr:SEL1-like repeat protein [Elusimicrobiota bacterium]
MRYFLLDIDGETPDGPYEIPDLVRAPEFGFDRLVLPESTPNDCWRPAHAVLEAIQFSAGRGNPEAQYYLARRYDEGEGVEKDEGIGGMWWKKAIESARLTVKHGDPSGQFVLGGMHYRGKCVDRDFEKAAQWFKRAAKQGHASATSSMGCLILAGEGVRRDPLEAIDWFKTASKAGSPAAQYNLGWMYQTGIGVDANLTEAAAWYERAAERSHAESQFNLGRMYEAGAGVPKDIEKARLWFDKAARQGHPEARQALAALPSAAPPAPASAEPAEAPASVPAAAEAADADTQFSLYEAHRDGRGVAKDLRKALDWLRKAAEQGYPDAERALGARLVRGDGVTRDAEAGAEWLRKAALKGHLGACQDLAELYRSGDGVPQDFSKSLHWHKTAADRGDPRSQYELGVAYEKGLGVEQDLPEAARWLRLAAGQRHAKAAEALDRVEAQAAKAVLRQPTPEEIERLGKVAFDALPIHELVPVYELAEALKGKTDITAPVGVPGLVVAWAVLMPNRMRRYVGAELAAFWEGRGLRWRTIAMENLKRISPELASFTLAREDGAPVALLFKQDDGVGPSRLLLTQRLAQVFPAGYTVGVPACDAAVALSNSAGAAERVHAASIIEKCHRDSARRVSAEFHPPERFWPAAEALGDSTYKGSGAGRAT